MKYQVVVEDFMMLRRPQCEDNIYEVEAANVQDAIEIAKVRGKFPLTEECPHLHTRSLKNVLWLDDNPPKFVKAFHPEDQLPRLRPIANEAETSDLKSYAKEWLTAILCCVPFGLAYILFK